MSVDYDQVAEAYQRYRKPDPRIAERIQFHTEGAQKVLNIGAGTGSYEPEDCDMVAVEPSSEMISQRKNAKVELVRGVAEDLPFKDNAFDISMGILTIHHWADIESGLKEMVRVTRNRIILYTWIGYGKDFWLENYIPEISGVDLALFPTLNELNRILEGISVETIEVPYDCSDGFMCAYWRRPEAYLNPEARKAISTFSRLPNIQDRLDRLEYDINSGAWRKKHGNLLDKESLDLGYRLVISER